MLTGLVVTAGLASVIFCSPPNIVLLSVDTLRADHLGCYGYEYDTSPAIDQFARDSLVFEDCTCEVPLTNPSFGSMLSSLYPRMTGTTRNGLKMPDTVPLIAERFRNAGYQTGCVQSNWTLKARLSGLDRGFDVYDDDFHEKRWGFIKPERYADDVTDQAIDLLRKCDPKKPFFFWIHYSDPHAPYRFHKDFNPQDKSPFWLKSAHKVRVKYDSEIAYTDAHIARLLDALPTKNTIVVFTADHGESLYEHDYLGHGRRIYQDNMHVPLIVRRPGIAPGRTTTPVRVLDIGPTLLAFAGLKPAPGMLGKDLMAGANAGTPARVIETYGGAVPKIPGAKAVMADRGPMRQGVIREGWKLILGGGGAQLYYLPDDPGEENNLAAENPERVEALSKIVETWDQQYPHGTTQASALSTDDLEALKSLGYLE